MPETRANEPLRHAHRLVRWQRIALYASGTLLLATGIAWLAVHYTVGAGIGDLPHPLEAWFMRLHGLAAFGALFLAGALAAAHIPQGWRLAALRGWQNQRTSGASLCVLGALLVATGYLLYYFAPEGVRPAIGWIHAIAGIAMAALIAAHRRGGT